VHERGATWRYLGLAANRAAELTAARADRLDEQAQTDKATRLRDRAATFRDRAAAAWHIAGDLADHDARRLHLAYQSRRAPTTAYTAGWTQLSWKHLFSLDGWLVVIGNYGAAGIWKRPLHLGVWGILLALCFLFFIKAFLLPKKVVAGNTKTRRHPAAAKKNATPTKPAKGAATAKPAGKDGTLLPGSLPPPDSDALEKRQKKKAEKHADKAGKKAKGKDDRRAMGDIARRMAQKQQEQRAGDARVPRSRRR
jgi:hypothetical protein